MDRQQSTEQHVSLPLEAYNKLYEQAYFNEKKAELDKERAILQESKKSQEDAFREKEKRLDEARVRGQREQRGAVTSQNWILTKHAVEGNYESCASKDSNLAVFDFSLELRIFDEQWTIIPLMDSQVITDAWAVQRLDAKNESATHANFLRPDKDHRELTTWIPVALGTDSLLLVQELDDGPSRQVFASSVPGLYRISFKAYTFVQSTRNLHSMCLNMVHPITSARLRLKQDAATKCAFRELSISPASQYSVDQDGDLVDITMRLPSTKTVEVRWRENTVGELGEWESPDGMLEKAPVEEPLQIIANHDALHSIMDGVLQSSHTLKFSIDSEQRALSKVRFAVQGRARVTSVTGHGVTSWQTSPSSTSDPGTCVEVFFKSSLLSDTVIVLMNTELELSVEAFEIPSVVCEGTLRQTGNLGIVKVANVEVHEQEAKGTARVGVDELPEELKFQTNLPIMFAYKYLSPQSSVQLKVIKHEQVDVLQAVAEIAFYEVLMSEGQTMHRLMMQVENSRQQYLEVRGIPSDARLWSLMVNSKPAKPVRGPDGSLMIPLLIGVSGNSNEGAQSTSVEMAYLVQREPLEDSGTMDLAPPRLDIPVSRLMVEVQWPETYEAKFTGSGQAVNTFSHPKPQPVNHDVGTDIVERNFDFNRLPASIPKKGVNVKVPRAGRRHRFEQLLVVDGKASLAVQYVKKSDEVEPEKGWFEFLKDRILSSEHREPGAALAAVAAISTVLVAVVARHRISRV